MWPFPYMMQGGSSLKEFEEFQSFLEEREKKRKDKEKEKYKPRYFSVTELFVLISFLSIPVGMCTSYLAVVGAKHWMEAMQLYLK